MNNPFSDSLHFIAEKILDGTVWTSDKIIDAMFALIKPLAVALGEKFWDGFKILMNELDLASYEGLTAMFMIGGLIYLIGNEKLGKVTCKLGFNAFLFIKFFNIIVG